MDEDFIIIMVKDMKTGFLQNELGTFRVSHYGEQLQNIFAYEQDGKTFICIELTTGKEISDEHFNSVYDYYNEDNFAGLATEFFEIDDCDNPSWEVTIPFPENQTETEQVLQEVMARHIKELERIFELIKNGD